MRILPILLCVAALAACDAGPKATPAAPVKTAAAETAQPSPTSSSNDDRRDYRAPEPVRLVAGKPLWTSNRQMSAEENARSHFERDGADFDAKTVDDFAAKAHAFTAKPPKGTLKITRPNGDVLLYEDKTNTFAVVARSGAPRTMFKPRDGMAYWQRQVTREKAKSARD